MAEATETQQVKNSRLGKRPVPIPKGVQVTIQGNTVKVKGPKGELERTLHESVQVEQRDGNVVVEPVPGAKDATQFHGLSRAIVKNIVDGVAEGYRTSLDLYGVGYRAEVKGPVLHLALGLSHPVVFDLPREVAARIETIDEAGTKRPRIHLESASKEALGQAAARIKSFRPPEPYKGKGVRFTGEVIRQKAGKAGGKSGGKGGKGK